MHVFILQRVIALVPLLLGVSLLVFLMTQLVPGDPVMMMLGEYSVASAEDIEKLRTQLGFNDPLHVQYGRYLSGLVQGDLGDSMRSRKPVAQLILQRLPRTIELTVSALLFAILFGTVMGITAALHHNSWLDYFTVTIALLGVSIPGFWLALLLILFFSVYLGWLPVLSDPGIKGLILPPWPWACGPAAPLPAWCGRACWK